MKTAIHDLHVPTMEEVANVFKEILQKHFHQVETEITDCPNLKNAPFHMSAEGICGRPILAQVGSSKYLEPLVQLNKRYDMKDILKDCQAKEKAFLIGAGAGPFYEVNHNCELVADFYQSSKMVNQTRLAIVKGNGHIVEKSPSTGFGILGEFLFSEGNPGKVIHVKATGRLPTSRTDKTMEQTSFSALLQQALAGFYKEQKTPMGVGGMFSVHGSQVKVHVMPEFSKVPLETPAAVLNWLKLFDVDPPTVFVGHMISHDPQNWQLRGQHFHGFNAQRTAGGHYHFELDPPNSTVSVTYEGYFVVGEKLLRMDSPA